MTVSNPYTLDELIYQELGINLHNTYENDLLQIDQQMQLNQVQIVNIVKRFYGDKSARDPMAKKRYTDILDKNSGKNNQWMKKSMMSGDMFTGDYVQYYAKVKEFGKANNWSD